MGKYIELMRPTQWIKNLVVLAGPLFSLRVLEWQALAAFAAFCLMASSCYVINDLIDQEADRLHPRKRHRPIASGAVRPREAVVVSTMLLLASVGLGMLLPEIVLWILLSYFVIVLGYSLLLKKQPILDVIVIAVGFVLRAVAGARAVEADVSPWLIACTFTLCMFLGFGKRRCELATLSDRAAAGAHRRTLLRYTPELLNHLTSVSAGIAIMTFLLYTMDASDARHQPPFDKRYLLYTLPIVAYGVFRYAMLIETGEYAGPMEIILRDRALLITGTLWCMAAAGVVALTHDELASPRPPAAIRAGPATPGAGGLLDRPTPSVSPPAGGE